ncbi:MAG: class I SAM-dependent methyltransferase [Candidatus Scalindua sp.]|nr:class I SAM-dependent methyltransferase [Candidatus Scalindua sp.]
MKVSIICPHDGALLKAKESSFYFCPVCNQDYLVEDGVIRLLDNNDDFYEGHYENKTHFLPRSEKPWHTWPLWLINGGYLWVVRQFVPQGATVVELGCAGGVRYFGQRYHMIGCDLSLSSLKKTEFYEQRIQADAAVCIPLPDSSVDAVVSSYFWEHILPSVKLNILSECQRILKPGGKIVFLYDVETKNPLIQHYKSKNQALYNKLFIDGDGHFGYQTPLENLATFKEVGFQILVHQGMEKTWLQSPSAYIKLSKFDSVIKRFLAWGARLGQQPFFYPYTLLMRLIDTFICPWLPANWARIDLVVCEKTKGKI